MHDPANCPTLRALLPEVMLLRALRLLLLSLLLVGVRPAMALEPLPAGLEQDVTRLIEGPREFGSFTLTKVRITALAVEFRLAHGDETAVIHLLPVDEPGFGEKVGVTKSFSAWLVSEPSAGALASAALVLKRVAEKDDGTFYVKAAALRGAQSPEKKELVEARNLGKLDLVRRALTWLALIGLMGWCLVIAARRPWKREEVLWWIAVGVLTAVAVVLRLKLPSWSPLHANNHGIAELRGLTIGSTTTGGPVETDRYGYAYRQIVRAVIGPWGGGYRAALGVAAIAGGLAIAPLAVFASKLLRNPWSGLIAALALALHPAHVILSLSESPTPLALTLWLISFAAIVSAREVDGSQRMRLTWIAALGLACASELSVPTLFLPAASLVAIVLWNPTGLVRSWKTWRWPALVAGITVSLHIYSLWPVLKDGAAVRAQIVAPAMKMLLSTLPANIAFDRTLTVATLVPLALVGLITLLVSRRWTLALSLLAMIAIPFIPAFGVAACRTDFIRYQTPSHLGLILLIAAIPLAAANFSRRSVTLAIPAILVVLLITPLRSALNDLQKPSLDAAAFDLARSGLARAGPNANVRIASRRSGKVINDFPEFIAGAGAKDLTIDDTAGGSTAGTCAVWLGPSCYSFTDDEVTAGLITKAQKVGDAPVRTECHRLLEQIDAKAQPFAAEVVTVPHQEQEFHRIPGEHLLIGLFPCAGSGAVATP